MHCRPALARGASGWLLIALLFVFAVPSAQATSLVRQTDLPGLVGESRRAALVEVVNVRSGLDERELHSTWVTLRVEDPLFGDELPPAGDEFTIKIYGARETMPDGKRLFVDGTPLYAPGQRYLLLLVAESPWGFTSAAGLYQGAFRIVPDDRGRAVARNIRPASRLFGDGGAAKWLDVESLPAAERRALAEQRELPYRLLRDAVLRARQEVAGGAAR